MTDRIRDRFGGDIDDATGRGGDLAEDAGNELADRGGDLLGDAGDSPDEGRDAAGGDGRILGKIKDFIGGADDPTPSR
jgi:hypothetical protein